MKIRAISSLLVFCLLAALFAQSGEPVQAQSAVSTQEAGLRVIESTSHQVVLELVVPQVDLEQKSSDRGPCQSLSLPGWGLSGAPGEPALPIHGALVGVPAGSKPSVTVVSAELASVRDGVDLCPAATLIQSETFNEVPVVLGEQLALDPAAYAANQDYPGPLASAGEISMIRSQQVMQILAQPFRYNPTSRQLTVYSRLVIRVDFGETAGLNSPNSSIDEGPFEDILRSQVVNYDAARAWRIHVDAQPETPARPTSPSCKLQVKQDGMVSATYETLQAACPQIASQDPRTFHLFNQDEEVAIQVTGESDGVFASGEAVIFYGQKINTRYTDTNVYWLTAGTQPGLRMAVVDGTPGGAITPANFVAKLHLEMNLAYLINNPSGPDNNRWYWNAINLPTVGPKTYTVNLANVSTAAGTARIRGFFKGYAASPQHHIHVSINGHLILQEFWPARGEFSFDVSIPQSYLVEGANTILVEGPRTDGITINQFLVDWFEVDYIKNYAADGPQTRFSGDNTGSWEYRITGLGSTDYLTWDITDPLHPVSIANAVFEPSGSTFDLVFQQTIAQKRQYLACPPANLQSPVGIVMAGEPELRLASNGADYVMITHRSFTAALQPLADYYTSRGLRVKVVDVQDVYDEFSGGVFTPQAIRDFLAYAYTNWTRPAPSFVLLVGDGNYDFMNYTGKNDTVFIPPFLFEVDPWMGETDADNRFVTISGTDILPDMALGRLPAQTAADVTAIVEKTLNRYQHLAGAWANNALFVAGANDPSAGNFPVLSDVVIGTYLPASVTVDRVYYGFSPITTGTLAQQAISTAIHEGRGLVHFIGHSNPVAWFGDPTNYNSRMFIAPDTIATLANANLYPIFISMTCYTGYFVQPGVPTLDEQLINASGIGAAATWSPTGQGVASGHDLLDAGFFTAIYEDNVLSIGMAANQAKYYLYANSSLHRELIDTYILFGDPAMLYRSNPTAVDLNYFRAAKAPGGVELTWETVSENTLGGFNLYRRELNGEYVKVNADLIPPQKAGQMEGSQYTYLDTGALPGTLYEYRLDVIENSLQLLFNRTTLYWPFQVQLPLVEN